MSCAAAPWQTRPRVEHQMHGRSRVGCWTGLEAPTPLPQPLCEDWSDQRLPQCGWPHVQARGCEAMDESTRWHAQTCPSIRAAGASTRRARSSTLLSPPFAAPCGQPYPHTGRGQQCFDHGVPQQPYFAAIRLLAYFADPT